MARLDGLATVLDFLNGLQPKENSITNCQVTQADPQVRTVFAVTSIVERSQHRQERRTC